MDINNNFQKMNAYEATEYIQNKIDAIGAINHVKSELLIKESLNLNSQVEELEKNNPSLNEVQIEKRKYHKKFNL